MAAYPHNVAVAFESGTLSLTFQSTGTLTEASGGTIPGTFEIGEKVTSSTFGLNANATYAGTFQHNGEIFVVFNEPASDTFVLFATSANPAGVSIPAMTYAQLLGNPNFSAVQSPACFAGGTLVAIIEGVEAVENIGIGSLILTAVGIPVRVKWIGSHTVQKILAGARMQPVRIRAGALGDGLPHSDLTVTADHGMLIDGLVINASALVNGDSIDWVPMEDLPDRVTYYHIETENHDVILANGAPAETFIDYAGRKAFDNYGEYLELYGAERIIHEMDRPRISARRLVPDAIRARLGIVDEVIDWDEPLSA